MARINNQRWDEGDAGTESPTALRRRSPTRFDRRTLQRIVTFEFPSMRSTRPIDSPPAGGCRPPCGVGATLVVARDGHARVARDGHAGAWNTGRDKPVPYDVVPCTSAPAVPGWNFHGFGLAKRLRQPRHDLRFRRLHVPWRQARRMQPRQVVGMEDLFHTPECGIENDLLPHGDPCEDVVASLSTESPCDVVRTAA